MCYFYRIFEQPLFAKSCTLKYDKNMQETARWDEMKRVLIVGAGKGGSALLNLLSDTESMKIAAVIDHNVDASGRKHAAKLGIPIGTEWESWLDKDIDIIIEATGNEQVLEAIVERKAKKTVVIPGSVAYIISELLDEKEALVNE
jgi:predicted dinucleotide-utilizing enzyme